MVRLGGTVYRVTIEPDQFAATVIITPVQEGIIEDDETAIFTLVGGGVTYSIGPNTVAKLTIVDDSPEVTLTLDDGAATEGGSDPGSFTIARSNSGIVAEALRVRVGVEGTARFDTDYPNPGMAWDGGNFFRVTIEPGQLTRTIIIAPVMDGIIEDDETAIFTLVEGGATYTVGDPVKAIITIADFVEGIFKDGFEDL